MAAHRYWRLYIVDNINSGASGYSSLIELEMFDVLAGTNLCTGGTPISTPEFTLSGWGKANAFDGVKNNDTGWAAAWADHPCAVGYDFGSGNDKDIIQFAITVRSSTLGQAPKTFWLQWSDDNVTWNSTQAFVDEPSWSSNETRTYTPEDTTFAVISPLVSGARFNMSLMNTQPVPNTFAGVGEISGKISIEGTPVANAIVRLHHADTGQLLRSTVSDGIGDYEFLNLRMDKLYDVVAEDPSQDWEKKVSSRRAPI